MLACLVIVELLDSPHYKCVVYITNPPSSVKLSTTVRPLLTFPQLEIRMSCQQRGLHLPYTEFHSEAALLSESNVE